MHRTLLLWLLLALPRAHGLTPAPPIDAPPSAAPWIQWNAQSDRVVSAPGQIGAAYPRARELSNGEILLVYHYGEGVGNFGSRVAARRSRDGGATWFQTEEVDGPREKGFWGFANPDFVELGGGRIMLVSAARGKADPGARDPFDSECRHSGLRVRFSDDYGATWGAPQMIAAGRGRVWEPAIVRLPNGEIEVFYANESTDLQVEGAMQSIESVRSTDGGKTWSVPIIVAENAFCRNGMPAALALSNGHVICAQEVVGRTTSPWISDTLHGRPLRFWLAQNQYAFGAAPFLARGPDGNTLLVFHTQYRQARRFSRLSGAWLLSDILVQHGNALGNGFGPASSPWPGKDALTGAFFPSCMTLRNGTVVVLASFMTVHPDGSTSTVVRWIEGRMTGADSR